MSAMYGSHFEKLLTIFLIFISFYMTILVNSDINRLGVQLNRRGTNSGTFKEVLFCA